MTKTVNYSPAFNLQSARCPPIGHILKSAARNPELLRGERLRLAARIHFDREVSGSRGMGRYRSVGWSECLCRPEGGHAEIVRPSTLRLCPRWVRLYCAYWRGSVA